MSIRKRIHQVACAILDPVLQLSFDARELENLCATVDRVRLDPENSDPYSIFDYVHTRCRELNPLSARIERTLHLIHIEQVAERHRLGDEAFVRKWFLEIRDPTLEIGGALWAIATSPEPHPDCLGHRLVRRVSQFALARWRSA